MQAQNNTAAGVGAGGGVWYHDERRGHQDTQPARIAQHLAVRRIAARYGLAAATAATIADLAGLGRAGGAA